MCVLNFGWGVGEGVGCCSSKCQGQKVKFVKNDLFMQVLSGVWLL